jgi:hypothetical protein
MSWILWTIGILVASLSDAPAEVKLNAAKELRLDVPPFLLARAEEVIE